MKFVNVTNTFWIVNIYLNRFFKGNSCSTWYINRVSLGEWFIESSFFCFALCLLWTELSGIFFLRIHHYGSIHILRYLFNFFTEESFQWLVLFTFRIWYDSFYGLALNFAFFTLLFNFFELFLFLLASQFLQTKFFSFFLL